MLIGDGDGVLDIEEVVKQYQDYAHVIRYPGGSLRFDHMAQAVGEIQGLMHMLQE